MNKDLKFLSGEFLEYEIPKDKRYLLKYFKNDLQRSFLKYFFVFGSHSNFKDHTGRHCNPRFLYEMEYRLNHLLKLHENAKRSLTEESLMLLQKIEDGDYRFSHKKQTLDLDS